jgi:hypothetical protein
MFQHNDIHSPEDRIQQSFRIMWILNILQAEGNVQYNCGVMNETLPQTFWWICEYCSLHSSEIHNQQNCPILDEGNSSGKINFYPPSEWLKDIIPDFTQYVSLRKCACYYSECLCIFSCCRFLTSFISVWHRSNLWATCSPEISIPVALIIISLMNHISMDFEDTFYGQ